MSKRMLMLIFILVILNTLTGCNTSSRRPSVLIDTSEFEACKRIDIGSKYEYVNFDVIETTAGKDVIVHFERRTPDEVN